MKPILVTGGTGQLASALAALAPDQVRVTGRPDFDFDRPETLDALFADGAPAFLVNAAAWTAVDAAETEEEAAMRANGEGPGRLAALCRAHGTRLIHISTDYVFDGEKRAPYLETDTTNPTGAYGRTKLAGEQAVMDADPGAIILRTAWVYAAQGKNFVRTMLNAARQRPVLRVVADQRGCPTLATDLAGAILESVRANLPGGIYHATGSGETTWHGFAMEIFAAAAPYGWPVPDVQAITTAEYPTPARRPADSRLDCSRLAGFGIRLPEWQTGLHRTVAEICGTPASESPHQRPAAVGNR